MVEFGSLFAGIGGFDLGLERAGMTCAWQVEIDTRCNEVLAHHWPDVQRYGDVRNVGRHNLESVDLICGGFPCQGLSMAGCRAGLADERSGLWWEFHRVIEELRPRWVIVENVPGLLSSWSPTEPPPSGLSTGARWEVEEASDLETILVALAEFGYEWAYRSLDAQYDGVAQRRKRVFIVGYSGNVGGLGPASSRQDISRLAGLPVKVLFESDSVWWNTAPRRGTGTEVAAPVKASPPSRRNGGSWPTAEEFVVTGTLNSGGNNGGFRTEPGGHLVAGPIAFDWQSGGDVRLNISEKHTNALQASQTPAIAYGHGIKTTGHQGDTVFGDGDVWTTLSAESANNGGGANAILHSRSGVRRLTPTECERLQGFPDGWTAVNGMKDTPRYRMLGNAVCVPVAEWIGQRVAAATDD